MRPNNQNGKRSRGRGRRPSGFNQPNVNRNTTFESNGPEGKLRGNAQQLFEKYTALAQDANSSSERISAEAFSQFADHYYRLQKEIEINNEAKETRIKNEIQSSEVAVSEAEIDKNDKRPPRRKRGFQIRENEMKEAENNIENKDLNTAKKDNTNSNNLLV